MDLDLLNGKFSTGTDNMVKVKETSCTVDTPIMTQFWVQPVSLRRDFVAIFVKQLNINLIKFGTSFHPNRK